MTPELTIIVPVFNTVAYLPECLNSCVNQTFRNWECILVDDGSSDGSLELCETFTAADTRFRLIRNPHQGVAAARNTGLQLAHGEYIGFLDSDDRLRPTMFQTMLETQKRSGAEVVICAFLAFEDEDTSVDYADFHRTTPRNRVFENGEIELPFLFDAGPWSKLFRRDFLEWYHLRFIPGIQFEDIPFWCAVVKAAPRYCYVPEQLYDYRQKRRGSTITSGTVRDLDFSFFATLRAVEALGRDDMLDDFANHMPLRALKAAAVAPRNELARFLRRMRALFRGFHQRHGKRQCGNGLKSILSRMVLCLWRNPQAYKIRLIRLALFWLRNDRVVRCLKKMDPVSGRRRQLR